MSKSKEVTPLYQNNMEQKVVMWTCKCGREIRREWFGDPGEIGQVWGATCQFCGTKYKGHLCKFSHLVNR